MNWDNFINQVVDRGIEAAKRDYIRKDQKALLDGSIAGFAACRDSSVTELAKLLKDAWERFREVDPSLHESLWFARGYYNEIQWVCNVVSAALYNQNLPVILQPTARGMKTAADILGVNGE